MLLNIFSALYQWIPSVNLTTLHAVSLLLVIIAVFSGVVTSFLYYMVINRLFFGFHLLRHWLMAMFLNAILAGWLSVWVTYNDYGVLAAFIWIIGAFNLLIATVMFYLFSLLFKGGSKYAAHNPH